MSNKISFGCDPEFFVGDRATGGKTLLPPAWFRMNLDVPVEIEEDKPTHPIFLRGDGYMFHEDGADFELAIRPASSFLELWDHVQVAYNHFDRWIEQFDQTTGRLNLPTIDFECARWINGSEELKNCLVFGCDPDEDAFNTQKRARVVDASLHPERYAGGHIHFGGHDLFIDAPLLAVRIMAATIGLASTATSDVPELEHRRTFLYGMPGKFRVQHYKGGVTGIEYRTPSTRWTVNRDMALAINKAIDFAFGVMMEAPSESAKLIHSIRGDLVKAIIDSDQVASSDLLNFVYEAF